MMEDFFDLEKVKKPSDIHEKYQAVFNTPIGREVLADILVNLCNFGMTLNPDDNKEVIEYNIGIRILEIMKIMTSKTKKINIINILCNNIERT
jgi:hypothetical protein